MCSRAILLAILATCRAVYVTIEQPSSSQMRYYPDLVETGDRIKQLIGFWREQYLPGTWRSTEPLALAMLFRFRRGTQQIVLYN